MSFDWDDYQARVADYVVGGMDRQSAELQVQYEMENEREELILWMEQEEFSPFETINS